MNIAEFLQARIVEDESSASNRQIENVPIDCWGPDRVLAECDAKRKILELHASDEHECVEMHHGVYPADWPEGTYAKAGEIWSHPSLELQVGPCPTLLHLAVVYANHPDYDPAWAPRADT